MQQHLAGGDLVQAHDRPRHRGLATARLADQRDAPAPAEAEADVADGGHAFVPAAVLRAQVGDPQHRICLLARLLAQREHRRVRQGNFLGPDATGGVSGSGRPQLRHGCLALRNPQRAARGERAAGRALADAGRDTGHRLEHARTDMIGDQRQQPARIGVPGPPQHLRCRSLFDDPARVHDRDPGRDLRGDGEVVGDVEQRDALFPAQAQQFVQDPGLRDHVKARCWLVQDDNRWLAGQRDRDADPLLLPAGELVRVPALEDQIAWQAYVLQPRGDRAVRIAAVPVCPDHFRDRVADPQRWVERRGRVLRNIRDEAAAQAAQCALVIGAQRRVGDADRARGDASPALGVAEQRQRGRRLARSGFADQAERFPRVQRQRHVLDDGLARRRHHLQSADLHQPGHACAPVLVAAGSGIAATAAAARRRRAASERPSERAYASAVRFTEIVSSASMIAGARTDHGFRLM